MWEKRVKEAAQATEKQTVVEALSLVEAVERRPKRSTVTIASIAHMKVGCILVPVTATEKTVENATRR